MANIDGLDDLTFSKQDPKKRRLPRNSTILQEHTTSRSLFGKASTSYRLILRKPLVKILGWESGVRIKQELVGGSILLTPVGLEGE